MVEKIYSTASGEIHYWTNVFKEKRKYLIFLPGLTADHRLFDCQIAYFKDKYNVLVWDAPGHAASYPFTFNFSLMDKATWLDEILQVEGIEEPILIGQSMGGYVGQAYAQKYPKKIKGFVAIDSAPLQRKFVTGIELWLLKRMEPVYRYYPWKSLLICGEKDKAGSCIRYSKAWHKETGIRLEWIKDAGHNSNTDAPEKVNQLIEEFCEALNGREFLI